MGKVTGFLEFERIKETYEAPKVRLQHWREFVHTLTTDEAKQQGARCMDCGIPSCTSGCPVHDLIPAWNDPTYRPDWRRALGALHSTTTLPALTGRAGPAPCEAACTLNTNDAPVGIKSIEHAI